MRVYLFCDELTGLGFIIESNTKEEAYQCASEHFEEPTFIEEIEDWEIELYGYEVFSAIAH